MADTIGVPLPNGCRITHGQGANVKQPFSDIPLTMHELSPANSTGFSGPLGFIEFTPELRLPRHIHMDLAKQRLLDERIMVLHGVGLVEIAGQVFVVAPGSLVDIAGGVPHTWTACPAGVNLPDGTVSKGAFTMVYEYEAPTSFFPTKSVEIVREVSQYEAWQGSLDDIRMPKLSAQQVVDQAKLVFDKQEATISVA